jgi:hypothetical protein
LDDAKDTNVNNEEDDADTRHQLSTQLFVEQPLSNDQTPPSRLSEIIGVVLKAKSDYFGRSKVENKRVETEHGESLTPQAVSEYPKESWDSKEVWFAGTHSDMYVSD